MKTKAALLGLTILMASVVAAAAEDKIDRKSDNSKPPDCYRQLRAQSWDHRNAKLACRPDVGPCEWDPAKPPTARQQANAKRGLCINE
jgi:hypothetical protein